MKKIIALLPMRAGSQRVINKNTRKINGKYLYEFVLEKLIKSDLISLILINTDISQVKLKYPHNNKIRLIVSWLLYYVFGSE